jgi:Trypsin-co-occurring domain 1
MYLGSPFAHQGLELAVDLGVGVEYVARMPLEGGGAVFFEVAPQATETDGPVKAGRVGAAIRELPRTLQETLCPVREAAHAVLDQLRQAGPHEVEVEFGVNLASQAGAVIAKSEAAVHLKVRVLWKNGEPATDTQ